MRASAPSFLLPLLFLASPSCALLYDFEDAGGAAATTTSGGGEGGAGPKTSFLVEQCLVFGGPGDDVPSRSAIALSAHHLHFTGTFEPASTPSYFGLSLEPTDAMQPVATAIGIFDARDLTAQTFRSTAHTTARPPSFVRSGASTSILFGGSFSGLADLYLDGDADDDANGTDGFLGKLTGTSLELAAPPWGQPVWVSGDSEQSLVAAAENGRGDVMMIGAALQLSAVGSCEELGNDAPFAYLRWMNEPEVDCVDQRTFEVSDEVPYDLALTPEPGNASDRVYVSLQASATTAPPWGRVVAYGASQVAGSFTSFIDGEIAGDAHFRADGLGRIRLAADGAGGVFTCANQEDCLDASCSDAARKPGAIEVGRLGPDGYQALLTTTRVGAGRVGCEAILVHGGAVIIGGSVQGEVVLSLGGETLTLRASAADDTDAFLARFTLQGAALEGRVFGRAGEQHVTTLARDPARPSSKELFVAGATIGPVGLPACDGSFGGQDVFLMRITVLDQASP